MKTNETSTEAKFKITTRNKIKLIQMVYDSTAALIKLRNVNYILDLE